MNRRSRPSPRLPLLLAAGALAVAVAVLFVPMLVRRDPTPTGDSEIEPAAARLVERPGISATAVTPDWSRLQAYAGAITREEFAAELSDVYAADGPLTTRGLVEISADAVLVATGDGRFERVRFAPSERARRKPPRYWRAAAELPPADDLEARPLEDVRVVIDPGHIGGIWAKMEERWYRMKDGAVAVKEGELTLTTAKLLRPLLEELGATVHLTRTTTAPVTPRRPEDFRALAEAELGGPADATGRAVADYAEQLFYRADEIRSRAQRINESLRPDIVLCLHFNAERWSDPSDPRFVPRNHLHLLVNGCYSRGELALGDQRLEMLERVFQGIHDEELAVTTRVAEAMAEATELPPYVYHTPNARRVGPSPYVYARNLLANRVYRCPTVFLEPYVMNNAEVYARIAAGDYAGLRRVAGVSRPSIFREYAAGVAEGLARYYRANRRTAPKP